MADWSDADVEILRRGWKDGASAREISSSLKFKFSRNAVCGKADRLDLPQRDPSLNHSWSHRTKPYISKPKPKAIPRIQIPEDASDPEPIGPIGDFPAGQTCRFIAGEVKNFQCCGLPGFPWCDFHAAKFLVKPQPRKT